MGDAALERARAGASAESQALGRGTVAGCNCSAVIPQILVEPELRAELESVLRQGETLTDFVETTVRNAIALRRVQTSFHARAHAASEAYHQTGVSVPVETVLERLQSKLDGRRRKLGR